MILPLLTLLACIADEATAADMRASLPDSDRQVILADAYAFGVTDWRVADLCLSAVWRHQTTMDAEVRAWNLDEQYGDWQREVEWRGECWRMLRTALNPDPPYWSRPPDWFYEPPLRCRLLALNRLRGLIGDEAFFAGVMPPPRSRPTTADGGEVRPCSTLTRIPMSSPAAPAPTPHGAFNVPNTPANNAELKEIILSGLTLAALLVRGPNSQALIQQLTMNTLDPNQWAVFANWALGPPVA